MFCTQHSFSIIIFVQNIHKVLMERKKKKCCNRGLAIAGGTQVVDIDCLPGLYSGFGGTIIILLNFKVVKRALERSLQVA